MPGERTYHAQSRRGATDQVQSVHMALPDGVTGAVDCDAELVIQVHAATADPDLGVDGALGRPTCAYARSNEEERLCIEGAWWCMVPPVSILRNCTLVPYVVVCTRTHMRRSNNHRSQLLGKVNWRVTVPTSMLLYIQHQCMHELDVCVGRHVNTIGTIVQGTGMQGAPGSAQARRPRLAGRPRWRAPVRHA